MEFKQKLKTKKTRKQIKSYIDIKYTEKLLTSKFKVVDRISNIKVSELPDQDESLKIITTKNINSAEVLCLINKKHRIKEFSASFDLMNDVAVEIFNKYNINIIAVRGLKSKLILQEITGSMDVKTLNAKKLNAKEIKCTDMHIKVFCIECENDNYYMVSTSTNPKTSSRIETYNIERSKTSFDNMMKFLNKC